MDRCIFSGSPRLRGDTGIRACWHESFEPRCGHPPIEGGFILRLGAGFSFLFLAKKAIIFFDNAPHLCAAAIVRLFAKYLLNAPSILRIVGKRRLPPTTSWALAREGNVHFKPVKRSEHLTGLKATKKPPAAARGFSISDEFAVRKRARLAVLHDDGAHGIGSLLASVCRVLEALE